MLTQYWIRVVLGLIIFTSIVQIAGLVSPLWIYLEIDNITVGVGLYYRIGCEASSGNNCTKTGFPLLPFGYNSTVTYDEAGWEAVTGLETASASFGVLLCVLMIVYIVGFGRWKKMNNLNTAMVIVAILAWLPNLAGLIIYIIFYGKVITRSPDVSARSFPWSALMCLFALILFIIITILIRIRCRNRNYVKNAIPTSTDSKIALNPSTKNQVMKRYFTPSPYREDRRQALYSSAYENDRSQLLGNGFANAAIEHTGIENRALENHYNRAIEYNVTDNRQDGPATRVIQTNNLSAGTFAGAGAASTTVKNELRGTFYDRDLGSLVNQNTAGNYGTEMIERSFVTRTVGETTHGGHVDRAQITNYQPEVKEINRQNYSQQQWQSTRDQEVDRRVSQEERVGGHRTILDHGRAYDAFSDIDAETVYYTGKEGFTPISLNRQELFKTTNVQRSTTNENLTNGYAMTREIRQPLPPVQEEQTVREITVIERGSKGKTAEQTKHFRIPADHNMTTGLQKAADYTVHTRTFTDNQGANQLVLTPGYLSGNKFQYNGTYIYRPYSEYIY